MSQYDKSLSRCCGIIISYTVYEYVRVRGSSE